MGISEEAKNYFDKRLSDVLIGPYSWSDMLGVAADIVAYGSLRGNGADIDDILEKIKEWAEYRANNIE